MTSSAKIRRTGLPRPVQAIVLLIASLVLSLGVLAGGATTAQARPDDGSSGVGLQSMCEQLSFIGNSSVLPAMRWDDASTHLHSRLGGALWDDVPQKVQRNMYTEQLLSVGNFFWASAAGFTEKASRFCPLDKAGGLVDSAAADVGEAILKSTIPLLAIALALVGFLWRKRQRGGSIKELAGTVAVIAIMATMVMGASKSTGGGFGGGEFNPGTLSPGWFVTRSDMITSALAAKPAQVLGPVELDEPEVGSRAKLSCSAYTKAMDQQYKELWGQGGQQTPAAIPLLISGMWEQSGLVAWKKAQFGGNRYGDFIYCRMLESFSSTPTVGIGGLKDGEDSVRSYMSRAGVDAAKIVPGALAWRQANDPVERDRQMIGWAACRSMSEADPLGGFVYSSPLLVAESHRKEADELCGRFFTDPGWDGDEFDAPVDASAVFEQAGADPEVVQFINVLHGKESSGGPVAAFAYALSGISVLAVFGLMSLAVIIAKLAALALMLTLFAVMTLALFTRDGLERVFRFGKTYIGLSFFVFASSLVMAILALITKICMSIGGTLLSSNELLATMWAGLSPLLAVVILAGIFKKARIPSPFSLKGGLAWGAAAGGAGAAAVMGFDRIGDSMKRGASRLGHSVAGLPAAVSRGGGGYRRGSNIGRSRTSRMVPDSATANVGPQTAGSPRPVTSRAGVRHGVAARAEALRHGASTAAGSATPMGDPTQKVDIGLSPAPTGEGSVADRFEKNEGKLTAADVHEHWATEMEAGERDVYEKSARQAARWQTAGAAASGARRLAGAAVQHRRKALLIGLGVAAAPLALSGLGAVALAGGAAAAAAGGVGGAVYAARRARQSHLVRRTTAVQSAQMDALRSHLVARQMERRSSVRQEGSGDTNVAAVEAVAARVERPSVEGDARVDQLTNSNSGSPASAGNSGTERGVPKRRPDGTTATVLAKALAKASAGTMSEAAESGLEDARGEN